MSTYTVDYALRKPSAIPSGLSSTVPTKAWLTLIRYAVSQMKEIRYYASRFMNLHLTRLLENKLPLARFAFKMSHFKGENNPFLRYLR